MGFRFCAIAALFAVGACADDRPAGAPEAPRVVAAPLVAGCNCASPSWTYVNTGGTQSYALAAGQSLCLASGTFSGNLSAASDSLVCVDTSAALNASQINFGGRMVVHGHAGTISQPLSFVFSAGAAIDNFGVTNLGSVNFNGAAFITNFGGAELNLRSSFALRSTGSKLINNGIFRALANFDSAVGTTFENNGYGYISGELAFEGESDNRGLLEITTRVNVNPSATFRNTCTIVSHGPYNVNGAYENHGLAFVYADTGDIELNVTSAGNITQGPLGQIFVTAATPAQLANLRVDGHLIGEGLYYVEDATVCQGSGSAIGTSAAAPIAFYDASPPTFGFFDTQTGTVQNVVRPAAPTVPTLAEARLGHIGSDCRTLITCSDDQPAGSVDSGCDAALPVCIAIDDTHVCVECAEDADCDLGYVCATGVRRCQPAPAPVTHDDTLAAAEGVSVTLSAATVAANDERVDPATVRLPGGAASLTTTNGTVTFANGTFTYTPKADPAASDYFVYQVCGLGPNAAVCVDATVNVTINRAPDLAPLVQLVAVGTTTALFELGPAYSDPEQHPADVATYQAAGGTFVGDQLTYSIPDPSTPGARSVPIHVCDSGVPAACDGGTMTVIVNDPPVLTTASLSLPRGGQANVSVASLVTSLGLVAGDNPSDGDTDGIGPVSVLSGPCVLNGATLRASAGSTIGTETCSVQICEELPVASPAVCSTTTITVTTINQAPVALDDSALVAEDASVLINVLANDADPDGDPLSLSTLRAPAHGTVVIEGDRVRYTPNANFNGADSFTYQVCDPSAACATATVNVVVAPDNDPPVAVDDVATTAYETAVSIDVLANDSDIDGDALTITSVMDPPHGTAVIANGRITYTPDPAYSGADSFTYEIRDASGATASATVTVTVDERGNQPPVAVDDAATVPADGRVVIPVRANDSDPDGDALVITNVSDPPHGSAVAQGGEVVYVPDPGYAGGDTFTYQVCDPSAACAVATVHVTVGAVPPDNVAPTAHDDSAEVDEDSSVIVPVLDNDDAGDDDALHIGDVGEPAHGTVSIVDGGLEYVPDPDYAGEDSFTYQACDPAGLCSEATVTITVTPINDPPVAVDDAVTTDEEVTVSIDVLANDEDGDGDALAIVSVTQSEDGTATIVDGQIVFEPAVDFSGTTTFTYTIADPSGATSSATVTITVVSDPDDDDDGISDVDEVALGTNLNDADTDDDGIPDGDELDIGTDPLNPDTDGDGILDGTEIGLTDPTEDTDPAVFVPDADPTTTTDPLNPDTDGGGLSDGVEDANHNGRVDPGEGDPNVPDDDTHTINAREFLVSGGPSCAGGGASLLGLLALVALRRRKRSEA